MMMVYWTLGTLSLRGCVGWATPRLSDDSILRLDVAIDLIAILETPHTSEQSIVPDIEHETHTCSYIKSNKMAQNMQLGQQHRIARQTGAHFTENGDRDNEPVKGRHGPIRITKDVDLRAVRCMHMTFPHVSCRRGLLVGHDLC